jgi:hypothetical protein
MGVARNVAMLSGVAAAMVLAVTFMIIGIEQSPAGDLPTALLEAEEVSWSLFAETSSVITVCSAECVDV